MCVCVNQKAQVKDVLDTTAKAVGIEHKREQRHGLPHLVQGRENVREPGIISQIFYISFLFFNLSRNFSLYHSFTHLHTHTHTHTISLSLSPSLPFHNSPLYIYIYIKPMASYFLQALENVANQGSSFFFLLAREMCPSL